ncbi:FHA domain-containing protein [Actinophytocola sediminis]
MNEALTPQGARRLERGHRSLAGGISQPPPGALSALAVTGGIVVSPQEGRTVLFGRNRPEVHVCIGEDDRRVSRLHGVLSNAGGQWWVANTGHMPIRLPGSRWLFRDEEEIPLVAGYTPLFVRGSGRREHLLELYVAGDDGGRPVSLHREPTVPPSPYRLSQDERLVLVVVGQRYLLHEANPQPLSRRQAAAQLAELAPSEDWTVKRVEHTVTEVRTRLSAQGVYGLVREEVGEPVGNLLNHNLLTELVQSTTLVPPDLARLDR